MRSFSEQSHARMLLLELKGKREALGVGSADDKNTLAHILPPSASADGCFCSSSRSDEVPSDSDTPPKDPLRGKDVGGGGGSATEHYLVVSIAKQRLWHFCGEELLAEYKISTSRAKPSCIENSLGTPDGLFCVCEKIGDGVPIGTVFKGRKSTGLHFEEFQKDAPGENLITSRILRLDGLEEGHNRGGNCDTLSRYVYIHGTSQEAKLGTPNSHGCILLSNKDIIELFDAVPTGTLLFVSVS